MSIKRVNCSKNYDVVLTDSFDFLNESIKKEVEGQKILIVTDTNTNARYFNEVKNALSDFEVFSYCLPSGEKSKNLENFGNILSCLAKGEFCRKDTVLALGGGVVGDIAGFAASCYMRGINFVNCPTTLLAMVDSSVGGKTAVDIEEGKNLVGTFYQPTLCYINEKTLKTLPESEIACGMGEIVKYAFLDKGITKEDIQNKNYGELISKCLDIKIKAVEKDEFDFRDRMTLNLGHTVGHAIESLSGYTIPHGLCVAKGLNAIINLSAGFYDLPSEKVAKMKALLISYDFNLSVSYTAKDILEKIKLDKKADDGVVNIVLLKDIGEPEIVKMNIDDLENWL